MVLIPTTKEAYIVGVESRTLSPVRIPRLPKTMEHSQIKGLYHCGEGAGYAGVIVASAMDGENVAEKIVKCPPNAQMIYYILAFWARVIS
jgi:uncharacterized protein